jgi:hypothetical protein
MRRWSWTFFPMTYILNNYFFLRGCSAGLRTIGVLRFDSRRRLGIFLFTASRPALGPTHPPIQWVPGALSLGVKRPDRETDHSPPSSAEVRECVELYLHSPDKPSWRGAQLKKKHRDNFTFTFAFSFYAYLSLQFVRKTKHEFFCA